MFGIGGTELLVILIVALVVLGPKSLPKIARTLGKAMGEFRRVSTEFQRTLNLEAVEEEEKERAQKAAPRQAAPDSSSPASPRPENSADDAARQNAEKTASETGGDKA